MAIDRIFGSYLPEGSISALNYASRIYQLPMNLFVNALATAIYTDLAFNAQNNDLESFKLSIEKSIRALLFFIIPATFGLIFLSTPIVQLAFQRGAFDALATKRTSESLTFYSIGLVFMSINLIMVRGFYALHDTRTPTMNSILALLSNIVLNTIFIKPLAHKGLALATSLASLISFILLYRSFKLKIGEFLSFETKKNILRFTLSGFIISGLACFIFHFLIAILPPKQLYLAISLLFSVSVVVFIYLYLGKRWKIDEARRIWGLIDRGLKVVTGLLGIR
jgi:putative peptidoglycan lipid II flippase